QSQDRQGTRPRSAAHAARRRRRGDRVRRRDFNTLLGAAVASWPLAARAQQPRLAVSGFLSHQSAEPFAHRLRAFRQGLKETGYVEGENIVIEYRWAEGQYDRLPVLAEELVRRQVAVIVVPSTAATLAAKAATTTIPIVFAAAEEPVRFGLVASLARPGGNLTGINFFSSELVAKRLELLRELVPRAARVAVLIDPSIVGPSERARKEVETAARALGLQIQDPQRYQQPRDRCRICSACRRAGRCPLRQPRRTFQRPAGSTGHHGGAPRGSHDIRHA